MSHNFIKEPPSKRILKQHFLDASKGQIPQDMINCVAHLILVIEDPDEVMATALAFMVAKLRACRADVGILNPKDSTYKPTSIHYNTNTAPVVCDGTSYSNQSQVFQKTWRTHTPIVCDNVHSSPILSDSRKQFESIQSKSILFQRLIWNNQPVGMTCIDFTHEYHIWTSLETEFICLFCNQFLAPLLRISHYWHNPQKSQVLRKPSNAELLAIKLAAKGMSYKQIANELNKSVRTIENQLRSARDSLDAANQAELITKCEIWL